MHRLSQAQKQRSVDPKGNEVPPSETELQQQLADSEGMSPRNPDPESAAKKARVIDDANADASRHAKRLGRSGQARESG